MARRKGKPASMESLAKGAVFRAWKKSKAKKREPCLYPSSPPCGDEAIAAHSIQNNGTLAKLEEKGHVYMIEGKPMFGYPPELPDFESRGRNEATTFKGLCNPHDTGLFLPIDTKMLDPMNSEHAFLLAYRSVLKEVHASMQTGQWTSEAYQQLTSDGVLSAGDELQNAAMAKPADDGVPLLREKRTTDRLYLASDYGGLRHETVPLPNRPPTLAVSGFFSAGRIGEKECFCALNVFPYDNGHLMLFSFRGHNELVIRERFLNGLRAVRDKEREHLASRVILENCANFVLSPSVCEAFGPDQRQAIRNYFWGTTALEQARFLSSISLSAGQELASIVEDVTGDLDDANPRLNLFQATA